MPAQTTDFDITAYRDMWLTLAEKLAAYKRDNMDRAIEAETLEALARNKGAHDAYGVCEALMSQVEREAGVNPLNRPAFQEVIADA